MSADVVQGRADVTVTSGAEVNLLTAASGGVVGIGRTLRWALAVTTNQDITVRVYKAAGANCDLVLITGYTTAVTSSEPLLIEEDSNVCTQIRVTGQADSSDATVNCDFRAWSGLG